MILGSVQGYDPILVGISVLVALTGAFAALDLAAEAPTRGRRRHLWTLGAAAAFGASVWTMHFVAMLADPFPANYDARLTFLSMVPPLVGSALGFSLAQRRAAGRWTIPLAGCVTGAGLIGMHYLGIASMQVGTTMVFRPSLVALSILWALGLCTLAHWLSLRPLDALERQFAAFVLAVGEVGLHHIGMPVVAFTSEGDVITPAAGLHESGVGTVAGLGVLGILGFFLLSERRRSKRSSLSHEARYRAIVETAVESIIVIDEEGTIVSTNPAARETFGYEPHEMIGQNVSMLMPEPDRSAHESYVARYLRTGERRVIGIGRTTRARRKDGSTFPIDLSVTEWHSGEKRHFTGIVIDRTERDAAEAALKASERRLAAAIEASGGGVFEHGMAEGDEVHISPRWSEILGFEQLPVASSEFSAWIAERVHPDDRAERDRALGDFLAGRTPRFEIEMRMRHASGHWVWVRVYRQATERAADGTVTRVSGMLRDITRRKKAERQAALLARHDVLTGLANRTLLAERLETAAAQATRDGTHVGFVIFDLNRFKTVNDTYGHQVGDTLLRVITERIVSSLRSGDTAARIGGDEFAIVLSDLRSATDVKELARRICRSVVQPARIEGQNIDVAATFGVATFPDDASDVGLLMRYGDLALFHAKERKRGHMGFFEPSLAEAAARRSEIEMELRRAIDRDELMLQYQPQFDLRTGAIQTVEALVRWRRPNNTLVPPGEFITIAEATGVIHALGTWVLNEACRQQARWLAAGNRFNVAVNVSPAEANTEGFNRTVDRALDAAGIAGEVLELEITEGLLMDPESPAIRDFLHGCEARGISLAIDDFGVGYSSLGYLASLPISKIKIDRSFIRKIGRRDDEALIEAIVALGHRLGRRVVAEGVEDSDQLAYLKAVGCDDVQGYLLCQPTDARMLETVFKRGLPN